MRTPRAGEVVILEDKGILEDKTKADKAFWNLATIEEVLPSRDGEVRVASVRSKHGHIFKRPLSEICIKHTRLRHKTIIYSLICFGVKQAHLAFVINAMNS
jgi:hypothetical protein